MKDNVEFNIKFIDMIRERPCLYDHTRVDYSNKLIQDAAWEEIAKTANESVQDCKEKWKNLRGSYTRHLKKCNRLTGPSGKLVKPYYLSDQLSFLASFTTTREPKRRRRRKEVTKKGETQSEDEENSRCSDEQSPAGSLHDRTEISIQNSVPFPAPELAIKKPKQVFVTEMNGHEMYYPPAQDTPLLENQDPDFAFLYSMLPDMQEMSNDQKRKFKIGIIKLAAEILNENATTSAGII